MPARRYNQLREEEEYRRKKLLGAAIIIVMFNEKYTNSALHIYKYSFDNKEKNYLYSTQRTYSV